MNKFLTLFFACLMAFVTMSLSAQEVKVPGWATGSVSEYEEYLNYLNKQDNADAHEIACVTLNLKMTKNPPKTYQDVVDAAEGTSACPYQWALLAHRANKASDQILKDSFDDCVNVKKDLYYAMNYANIKHNRGIVIDIDKLFDVCVECVDKYPNDPVIVGIALDFIVHVDGRDGECLALLKKMNRACSLMLTDPDLAKTYEPIVAKIRTMIGAY